MNICMKSYIQAVVFVAQILKYCYAILVADVSLFLRIMFNYLHRAESLRS